MAITAIAKSVAWLRSAGLIASLTFRNIDDNGNVIKKPMSVEDVAYPSTYGDGALRAGVQKFGTMSRTCSDIKGRNETAALSVVIRDVDGSIRGWFEDPYLRNVFGTQISANFNLTTDRGNGITPAPGWNGLIKKPAGVAGAQLQFDGWDLISALEQGGPADTFFPISRDFPMAPAASLKLLGQRWYGLLSDEPADAITGAPIPVAESATHATGPVAASSLVSPENPLNNIYGVLPSAIVALAGFSSVQGNPAAPAAPTAITLTPASAGGGSPPYQLSYNLNGEGGYRFQRRAMAGSVPSDPFPYVLEDPAGFIDLETLGDLLNQQVTVTDTPGAGGATRTGEETAVSQIAGPFSGGAAAYYRPDQVVPSTSGSVVIDQEPPSADPLPALASPPYNAGARLSDFSQQLVYALTWVTASGETGASVYWINRQTGFLRTIRGCTQPPPGGALSANLYKSTRDTTSGALGGFTQMKSVPVTNLNGSGNFFWEDDLSGTGWTTVSGIAGVTGAAATQGMIPTVEGAGSRVDALGMTWPTCAILSAGANKSAADGSLTAYSRDSSKTVTALNALSGSQISIPGIGDYATRWGSNPFFVINGRRWVIIPLAGQLASDYSAGKVTIWFNGGGVETVGDGSGTRIDAPAYQLKHLLYNDAGPLALGSQAYLGMNWASTAPTFTDGRPAVNDASFDAAHAFCEAILGTGRDVGAFIVPQGKSWADIIAQLSAVDSDAAPFPDENGAICLKPEAGNPNARIRTDLPITETSEIVALSASWQDQTTTDYYYNTLTYTYGPTFDTAGSATNQQSVLLPYAYGQSTMRGRVRNCSETLDFLARRDPNACFVIATRFTQRATPAPRDAVLKVGLFAIGGNGLQIGDLVPVTHSDGTGVGGWIGTLLEVRGISVCFDDHTVLLNVRELNPTGVNDDMVLTWFWGGSLKNPVSNSAYPSGSTGDKMAPDTDTMLVDSGKLQGTYLFEADGYVDPGVTLTLSVVNIDDAPDTPIAELTITSTTNGRAVSSTVLAPGVGLAAPGIEKNYRIKQKASGASAGVAGYFCAARLKKAS